ncbi:hypothetical protein CRG98_022529 [Punica granatum]|uniref:Uncharacterized protein n=1 Tax=Punica granatum TaxID=22663 RepID=A0A2I0JL46_PUNGR|nr:hypothetical protein CRG98_022529 [Punica granatum]
MTTMNSLTNLSSESKPPSSIGNRGANPQKMGQQLSLNKLETSPDQSPDSDNKEAINAAGGRNSAQTKPILIVGGSKRKEIDSSERSFLRLSSDGVCIPVRKGKERPPEPSFRLTLCTRSKSKLRPSSKLKPAIPKPCNRPNLPVENSIPFTGQPSLPPKLGYLPKPNSPQQKRGQEGACS